jgi:hypothetical protein
MVDVLHVATANGDHHLQHTRGTFRREQQVDVVGHQHVGVQPATLAFQCLAQPPKIGESVLIIEEAKIAVGSMGWHDFARGVALSYAAGVDRVRRV